MLLIISRLLWSRLAYGECALKVRHVAFPLGHAYQARLAYGECALKVRHGNSRPHGDLSTGAREPKPFQARMFRTEVLAWPRGRLLAGAPVNASSFRQR